MFFIWAESRNSITAEIYTCTAETAAATAAEETVLEMLDFEQFLVRGVKESRTYRGKVLVNAVAQRAIF